jgi:fluoride exporter
VVKIVIRVIVGGALGATLREFLMLIVPQGSRGFPLDILIANLVAALLLGLVAGLYGGKATSDGSYALIGTGICGGLSTFSSFAYGSDVLLSRSTTSAVVALTYVLVSLITGYIAVIAGLKLGGQRSARRDSAD